MALQKLPYILVYVSQDTSLFNIIKLNKSNHVVINASDADYAIEIIEKLGRIKAVILDLNLPNSSKVANYIITNKQGLSIYQINKFHS